jgi:multidrug resistance protein, MATE family
MTLLVCALPSSFWAAIRRDFAAAVRPDFERIRMLLKIGWAAAIESLADLGVSTYMSILGAQLGTILLAAHQVVLDLDAFVYMAPLGLSYATSVRVGQSAGRNNAAQARMSAKASLRLGLSYVAVASTIFVAFSHTWAGLYSNDATVIKAAVPIFILCGALQAADAVGIIVAGALVGVGDTRTPLIVNVLCYWVVGMPLSYALTFHYGLQLRGLWFGRVLAAVASGTILSLLLRRRLQRIPNLAVASTAQTEQARGFGSPRNLAEST